MNNRPNIVDTLAFFFAAEEEDADERRFERLLELRSDIAKHRKPKSDKATKKRKQTATKTKNLNYCKA
jgi:hypothetical protein